MILKASAENGSSRVRVTLDDLLLVADRVALDRRGRRSATGR